MQPTASPMMLPPRPGGRRSGASTPSVPLWRFAQPSLGSEVLANAKVGGNGLAVRPAGGADAGTSTPSTTGSPWRGSSGGTSTPSAFSPRPEHMPGSRSPSVPARMPRQPVWVVAKNGQKVLIQVQVQVDPETSEDRGDRRPGMVQPHQPAAAINAINASEEVRSARRALSTPVDPLRGAAAAAGTAAATPPVPRSVTPGLPGVVELAADLQRLTAQLKDELRAHSEAAKQRQAALEKALRQVPTLAAASGAQHQQPQPSQQFQPSQQPQSQNEHPKPMVLAPPHHLNDIGIGMQELDGEENAVAQLAAAGAVRPHADSVIAAMRGPEQASTPRTPPRPAGASTPRMQTRPADASPRPARTPPAPLGISPRQTSQIPATPPPQPERLLWQAPRIAAVDVDEEASGCQDAREEDIGIAATPGLPAIREQVEDDASPAHEKESKSPRPQAAPMNKEPGSARSQHAAAGLRATAAVANERDGHAISPKQQEVAPQDALPVAWRKGRSSAAFSSPWRRECLPQKVRAGSRTRGSRGQHDPYHNRVAAWTPPVPSSEEAVVYRPRSARRRATEDSPRPRPLQSESSSPAQFKPQRSRSAAAFSVRESGKKEHEVLRPRILEEMVLWLNSVLQDKAPRNQVESNARPRELPEDCDGSGEVGYEEITFEEPIGSGSFGAVWRGQFRSQEVAIKQCKVGDPVDAQMLLREIRYLQRLRHPSLVSFLGCCSRPPHVFLIMEFMPAGSLHALLFNKHGGSSPPTKGRGADLSFAFKAGMALQVAEGLGYLHDLNVVHRDLKTLNIVLDNRLNCKICDFGLTITLERSHLTVQSLQGSPRYMAPEQFETHAKITEKVDIWQMGCVMMELFCLTVPFQGFGGVKQIAAELIVKRRGPTLPPNTDERAQVLIQACLRLHAKRRPCAGALVEALVGVKAVSMPQ